MNGTFSSTGDLRRITRMNPRVKLRLFGLATAFLAGTLLILWMNHNIGQQMNRLQNELAAIKSERFYTAVHMRSAVRKLNSTLLGYHLDRQTANRDLFRSESVELKSWLLENKPDAMTPREQELFRLLEQDYERYRTGTEKILQKIDRDPEGTSFAQTYEQLRSESRPLLELLESVVQGQRAAFDQFLTDGRSTVAQLQRMFMFSLWLLLALTISLVVLVYRGMIAPLQQELDEKRVIIERQEKLASLGLLAAGVAHEIRNPLTAIKFRLFTLKKSMPPAFSENEDTQVVEGEINRLERIVKDFLYFARPSDPDLVRVSVGQIQSEVHDLLKTQLEKSAIQLQLELSPPVWVYADTQQIKQVLINLIQNAADSIERNGTIVLRVLPDKAEFDGRIRPAAVLQVADTGKGIPPEVEKRLFDPFFSTKETGTGLGLALAARIVARHGGLIRHHTQLNHGTTFEIVLPRLEDDETNDTPHRR